MTKRPLKEQATPRGQKETKETEIASMTAIAVYFGARKQETCSYLWEGVCDSRAWPNREEIPEGAGVPFEIVKPKPSWKVRPTPLFCAFCPTSLEIQELEEGLAEIEAEED